MVKRSKGPEGVFLDYSRHWGLKWTKNPDRKNPGDPVGFFHVYYFKCACNDPMWNEWESAKSRAANGEECHNPKCKGRPRVQPDNKTPVLSPTPCSDSQNVYYGAFKCPNPGCDLFKGNGGWRSAWVYGRMFQGCGSCGTRAYAYEMRDESYGDYQTGRFLGKHRKENCEACQKGLPCAGSYGSRFKGRGNADRYYPASPKKNNKKTGISEKKGQAAAPNSPSSAPSCSPPGPRGGPPSPSRPLAVVRSRPRSSPRTPPRPPSRTPPGSPPGPRGGPPSFPVAVLRSPPRTPPGSPPVVAPKVSTAAPTAITTSGDQTDVIKMKKKRKRNKKKTKADGAPQLKVVSPAREHEGKVVKLVQDLSKMSFPKNSNEAKAPKIE